MPNQTPLRLPGLSGKRVAVTAGASGIGLSIARLLREQGAQIAVCDVDPQALSAAREELGDVLSTRADVSDETSVDGFFDAIQAELGGLDALVNNAGIAGPTGKIEEIAPSDWRRWR